MLVYLLFSLFCLWVAMILQKKPDDVFKYGSYIALFFSGYFLFLFLNYALYIFEASAFEELPHFQEARLKEYSALRSTDFFAIGLFSSYFPILAVVMAGVILAVFIYDGLYKIKG